MAPLFDDVVSPDGQVHDERRVAYLRHHFAQAAQAIADGLPLKGYFVWSLLDNFEWACGQAKRFGFFRPDLYGLCHATSHHQGQQRQVRGRGGGSLT